jgi:hypothetical protein
VSELEMKLMKKTGKLELLKMQLSKRQEYSSSKFVSISKNCNTIFEKNMSSILDEQKFIFSSDEKLPPT